MKRIHDFDIVHDSQQVFRLILKAISNPFQTVNIEPYAKKIYSDNNTFLALAFTLLDNETTFFAFDNMSLKEDIISFTLAQEADISSADFIFVEQKDELKEAIQRAKCGTLKNPHKSSSVVVKLAKDKDISLTAKGPGIKEKISVTTNSIVENALTWRDELNFEYPQGLDFLFIDDEGNLFAVPRLIKKEA